MTERLRIGETIRSLRRQHDMTGAELGKKVGLSQSKISKIETGTITNLKIAEIEKILNILEAPQDIRQRSVVLLGRTDTSLTQQLNAKYYFEKPLKRELSTKLLRGFSFFAVPALLQTLEFRQALLKKIPIKDSDIRFAMRMIVQRQELLWDKKHHYHFILHETGLYSAFSTPSVQLAQLDRLLQMMGLSNIRFGILPLEAGCGPIETCPFVVYDESRLIKCQAGADILSNDTDEIDTYLKIFAALEKKADYGDNARALIRKAMDYFS
jgi:transcriptional regulator with XRE-family HTH domain